jgi:hypothetical protein
MKPISGTFPVQDANILVYNFMIKRRNTFSLHLYDLHQQSARTTSAQNWKYACTSIIHILTHEYNCKFTEKVYYPMDDGDGNQIVILWTMRKYRLVTLNICSFVRECNTFTS